jgi:hypothetical protein
MRQHTSTSNTRISSQIYVSIRQHT